MPMDVTHNPVIKDWESSMKCHLRVALNCFRMAHAAKNAVDEYKWFTAGERELNRAADIGGFSGVKDMLKWIEQRV